KNAKELSKAASRALGALCGKVIRAGGMTHSVFTKLYNTMVEPVLLYGSGVWGYKDYSCISSVQTRACKFFLNVGKHTSNLSTRGDMGWTSCKIKLQKSCLRLLCKLHRLENNLLPD
ncbi:Hypothetical predicted protein, partial [Mytilus galloprovincialis]